MGCQSEVYIGQWLTFSVTTHDPATGILTDADAVPSYRLYEDLTAAPILTGNLAALDALNTTGFYAERIACTLANGFENGKVYTVYIEATVLGSTGGISYAFRAIAAPPYGTGSTQFVYNVTDTVTLLPIAGVTVWVSSDIAGANVIANGVTDALGNVTFWLPSGANYFFSQKAGYSFPNPDTEIVP